MPFSQSSQISTIVSCMLKTAPNSLLDVGVGMGQYGFLARINLEQEHLFIIDDSSGRQRPKDEWRVRIDGVEAFAGYLTPVHDYAYNQVMIGDALDVLPTLANNTYEMVIAIDVLEHFHKSDGEKLLAELKRVTSKVVLISTPKLFHAQDIPANPYENHRSLWAKDELITAGFQDVLPNMESWIAIHRKY